MKRFKTFALAFLLIMMMLVLASCVPGDGANTASKPAGFFMGIWHGWIAPVSLILSIFNDNLSIYETANTGFFYDLGYYIAVISGFGGIAFFRKSRS